MTKKALDETLHVYRFKCCNSLCKRSGSIRCNWTELNYLRECKPPMECSFCKQRKKRIKTPGLFDQIEENNGR